MYFSVSSITILVPLSASLIVRVLLFIRSSRASVSLVVRFLGLLFVSSLGSVFEHLLSSCWWPFGAIQADFALKGWG